MAPKQTDPQFKLRLTPALKDLIEKSALSEGRSMNAEILHRLEASYSHQDSNMEQLRLSLPREVMESVIITALAHDQSISDFVADAIQRETYHLARFQDSYEEREELRAKVEELEEKVRQAIDSADAWKLLHRQKQETANIFANLLSATINEIISRPDEVPSDLIRFAKGMRSSLNSAIPNLFDADE